MIRRLVRHRSLHVALVALAMNACSTRQRTESVAVRIPDSLTAADTAAIVALALRAFKTVNGPIVAVSPNLSCTQLHSALCPEGRFVTSPAIQDVLRKYAKARDASFGTNAAAATPCLWSAS